MINSTDLKNGITFLHNGKPYKVVKYNFIKMGRGGATVRVNARNLESGSVEEKTFSSNIKVEEVKTSKRVLQYLYKDEENAFFMDQQVFDQIEVPIDIISDELPFVKEGQNATILFWENKPLSIEIPPKVTMEIIDTPPGVKGNSASNIYKQAVLQNGIKIKVPLFINNGEKIIVDTRTGEYVERAK